MGELDGEQVYLHKGEYGFYLKYKEQNVSLPKDVTDPKIIDLKFATKAIKEKKAKTLGEFDIKEGTKVIKALVLNGPYGPYIKVARGKKQSNYPVPKGIKTDDLTNEKVLEIISKKRNAYNKGGYTGGSKRSGKKLPFKKNTPEKVNKKDN